MFWLQFLTLLLCIFIGARLGGVGLGVMGGVGMAILVLSSTYNQPRLLSM